MASHQANKFLEVITNGDLESGIIDEAGIEAIFDHESISNPGEKIGDKLVELYNKSNMMNKSASVLVDGQMLDSLNTLKDVTSYRLDDADILADAKILDSNIADDADTKTIIHQVLEKLTELKDKDPSFKFVVDGDDRYKLTRDYVEGNELSEAKAKVTLRNILNNAFGAIKSFKGTGDVKTSKDNIITQRINVIEGKPKQKFESKVNDILNKFDQLRTDLNIAEADKWSEAKSVADMVTREKEQTDIPDNAKLGENTVAELFKSIISIFAGSKSEDVQGQVQNIVANVSRDESLGDNSFAEHIERTLTNLTSSVV